MVHAQTSATTIYELSCVHSLSANEVFLHMLVLVWMAELDHSQWCATPGIVNNLLHDTLDIAAALGVIKLSELCRTFAVLVDGAKDSSCTLSLCYTANQVHI